MTSHSVRMIAGLLVASLFSPAQAEPPVAPLDDGPYIFHNTDRSLESLWVCDGQVVRQTQPERDTAVIPARCGYPHPVQLPGRIADPESRAYSGQRIVALSDIHGQYEVMWRLLRAHNVIDTQDNWSLGDARLVITGDVFDRGPKVTETFWLLFRLQQQAHASGGAVHFLLGNHETMVLYDDLRYVNPKYLEVARLLDRSYPALYGTDSVHGRWLRTRPVLLQLGDTLFLHGGIAPENLELVNTMEATNASYRRSLGQPKEAIRSATDTARLYDGKTSPIWYRGYFNGQLSSSQVGALVDQLGLARIVVGHTSMDEIGSFHGGRIIAIDSSIKKGESGELLFIEDGQLSRGLLDGSRQALREQETSSD
jgi:hypothetical protein